MSQHAQRAAGSRSSPWMVLRAKWESGPPSCWSGREDARTVREAPLLRRDALRHMGRSLGGERSVLLQGETERAGQLGGGRAPSGGR